MADTNEQATQTTEKQTPVISKTGKMERVEMTFQKDLNPNISPQNEAVKTNEGADATTKANDGAATIKEKAAPAPTELTEDQLKAFFEAKGIKYEGLDKLKEKVNYTPTSEPTPEQLVEKEKAAEKRRVDTFVKGGGTVEQYVALKGVAEANIEELSKNTLKAELKTAGFNDEQIETLIKERYYQLTDEEIEEQGEDETDKEYKKRLKAHFTTKLSNRSSYIQTQAKGILAGLNDAIKSEDSQVQNELTISSNIEEQFKTLQREDTYELGSINGKAIEPIKSQVPEEELALVRDMLKDPDKRNNFLYNKEGGINITNIANVLAENAKLKAAVKVSYHEGSTRTNAHWQKTFGGLSPHELGVGGNGQKPTNGDKKTPASVGKVVRVQPQPQR